MNYPIQVLTKQIKTHQKSIEKLKDVNDIEMVCEQTFIDNDISEHESRIKELQKSILILLDNEKK